MEGIEWRKQQTRTVGKSYYRIVTCPDCGHGGKVRFGAALISYIRCSGCGRTGNVDSDDWNEQRQ